MEWAGKNAVSRGETPALAVSARLPSPSLKLIPSDSFPPTTHNSTAPVWDEDAEVEAAEAPKSRPPGAAAADDDAAPVLSAAA